MRPILPPRLACPCCGQGTPSLLLIDALNAIQTAIKEDLTITSACRCPKHNAAVGGALHSRHLSGEAADVTANQRTPLELYLAAEQVRVFREGGIGLYPENLIHVDVRPTRARWYRYDGHNNTITDYLHHHAHL